MAEEDKENIFDAAEQRIKKKGFRITDQDRARPWGGFFVLDEAQTQSFVQTYFNNIPGDQWDQSARLSPKILVVAPGKRLSWQYHHRRAELWRVIEGPVGIITSDTDEQGSLRKLNTDETVRLDQGERHRLVGLDNWAVLAEIWQHTDRQYPSDEEDIVRLEDDFGR
ncbi:MAG: phosphoheptose isomerase [Balneolaceae bacterium]